MTAVVRDQIAIGRVKKFRRGWAKVIFGTDKAHYFTRKHVDLAVSHCGYQAQAGHLLNPGTFERCKKCSKAVGA